MPAHRGGDVLLRAPRAGHAAEPANDPLDDAVVAQPGDLLAGPGFTVPWGRSAGRSGRTLPIPESSVSDLWVMADWVEAQGDRINTRFTAALPFTR